MTPASGIMDRNSEAGICARDGEGSASSVTIPSLWANVGLSDLCCRNEVTEGPMLLKRFRVGMCLSRCLRESEQCKI